MGATSLIFTPCRGHIPLQGGGVSAYQKHTMNYAELSRIELEDILLPPCCTADDAVCREPADDCAAAHTPQRDHQLRHVLSAAHELLTRIAEQEIKSRCLLSSPELVRHYLRVLFAGAERETFVVIYLDNGHRVIEVERPFSGTLSEMSVYPREIARRALQLNAAAVICAHPHPSLDETPSRADIVLTKHLQSALALIRVRLLDHFVVAGTTIASCAEQGVL